MLGAEDRELQEEINRLRYRLHDGPDRHDCALRKRMFSPYCYWSRMNRVRGHHGQYPASTKNFLNLHFFFLFLLRTVRLGPGNLQPIPRERSDKRTPLISQFQAATIWI